MLADFLTVPPECEIVTTRVMNASQENVSQAWANPAILQKWWGPAGFTNTFHEFEFKPGGKWRFTMHGLDKGNYENEVVFIEINPPELIVWDRISKPLFRVVATFEKLTEDTTKLTFRMQFDTKEACNKLRGFVVDKNEENFDKLEKELATINA